MASLNSVTNWDEVVDVLICGFGCAGASAAIEARDTDANARIPCQLPMQLHELHKRRSQQAIGTQKRLKLSQLI